jgi:hypothetical protein
MPQESVSAMILRSLSKENKRKEARYLRAPHPDQTAFSVNAPLMGNFSDVHRALIVPCTLRLKRSRST